jgi:hypothetical protein
VPDPIVRRDAEDFQPPVRVLADVEASQAIDRGVELGPALDPPVVRRHLPGVPDAFVTGDAEDFDPAIGVLDDPQHSQPVDRTIELCPHRASPRSLA